MYIIRSRTPPRLRSPLLVIFVFIAQSVCLFVSFCRTASIAPSVSRFLSSVCPSVGVRRCVYRRRRCCRIRSERGPCVWDDAAGTHGRGRVDALFRGCFDTIFFDVLTTGRADVASRARGAFYTTGKIRTVILARNAAPR